MKRNINNTKTKRTKEIRYEHVLLKSHTYDYYGKKVWRKGKVLVTSDNPKKLKIYVMVLGMGANEVVPNEKIGIRKMVTEITTKTTYGVVKA